MHQALALIGTAISLAHDRWRSGIGRRRPLSGTIAALEQRISQIETENVLLRRRVLRLHDAA